MPEIVEGKNVESNLDPDMEWMYEEDFQEILLMDRSGGACYV